MENLYVLPIHEFWSSCYSAIVKAKNKKEAKELLTEHLSDKESMYVLYIAIPINKVNELKWIDDNIVFICHVV